MPQADHSEPGVPCWVDLMTSDPAGSRAFYESVLGWTALEASEEFGGYFMFAKGDQPVSGAMPNMSGGAAPDAWTTYVHVADIESTLARALEHGGAVAAPAMQVGDVGTMAVIVDPTGATIGLWMPNQFPGFALADESGAPGWFELHTNDYDRSVAFYRDVFDWDIQSMSDTPEFRYATAKRDGEDVVGIYDAAAALGGDSSRWFVYYGVDDADAAVARAEALGATVLGAAQDSPYGRLATLADPTGARFMVIAPNA